jgi:hypothetical protein
MVTRSPTRSRPALTSSEAFSTYVVARCVVVAGDAGSGVLGTLRVVLKATATAISAAMRAS